MTDGYLMLRRRDVRWACVLSLIIAPACVDSLLAQQHSKSKNTPAIAPAPNTRPDIQQFRARGATILSDSREGKAYGGILVADPDTSVPLYSLNEDHFFTPASNAKVFTTAL